MSELAVFIGSLTSIFSIANPFGAIPAFLALTASGNDAYRRQQIRKASFYMFLILAVFFIAGTYIVDFFALSLEGMRIAGGIMLMQASFSMLNPEKKGRKISDEDVESMLDRQDISFSPLAMPLLSGPGSIAVVLGLSSSASELIHYPIILASILSVAILSFLVLSIAPWISKFLGENGITVMTRFMGFIGLCIGVQFIINGVVPLIK